MASDPYAVLGVPPGSSERELARAYKRLAKRWHPDRAGEQAARRMAEINQAYELARLDRRPRRRGQPHAPAPAPARRRRRIAGHWLREPVRRALGRELLLALREGEQVELVATAETWASPQTLLVVTDRRLLWLLDDAITGRVRSLGFEAIAEIDSRSRWPLRTAVLRVRGKNGRRHAFAGLRPDTAALICGHVRGAAR
jgi:curved DNA-binding protein CbpA